MKYERLKNIALKDFAKIVSDLSEEYGDKRLITIGECSSGDYIFFIDNGTGDDIEIKVPRYERRKA